MNENTLNLVKHLTKLDRKTLTQKALKLSEECGEVSASVLPYEQAPGTMHKFVHKDSIAENCTDVMLVALSMLYSLGYDDSTIGHIMQKKALYWSSLQENEAKLNVKEIPHEIHITVTGVDSIDGFKNVCTTIGVKAIILQLHTKSSQIVKDMMTSSVFIGTTTDAIAHAEKLKSFLDDYYDVTRIKVEVPPFHPAVPSLYNNAKHVKDGYFETHIEVYIDKTAEHMSLERLKENLQDTPLHVSNNFFKMEGDQYTVMVTYRVYDGKIEEFKHAVAQYRNDIEQMGFVISGKTIIEYALYDTKTNHDSEWMANGAS